MNHKYNTINNYIHLFLELFFLLIFRMNKEFFFSNAVTKRRVSGSEDDLN